MGFLVTYLFIALQKVLKKVWTFCFFATFTFTILVIFTSSDIVYVDWNLLSRRTQATFSQVGRTAGIPLTAYQVAIWTHGCCLGWSSAVSLLIAFNIHPNTNLNGVAARSAKSKNNVSQIHSTMLRLLLQY